MRISDWSSDVCSSDLRWGRKVAAHSHGAEGIKMAVRAGVDSIEHGSFLDDEGIALMKQHGTWLVSDVYNDDYILAEYDKLNYPEKIIAKERLVGRPQRENFRQADKAGVKIGYGKIGSASCRERVCQNV